MTVLQVLVFYFVRCVLAFSCCVCELYFYKWVYTPSTLAHTFGADYSDKDLTGWSFLSDTGLFVRNLVYTWVAWCWRSSSWVRECSARQQVGGHLLPAVGWGTFLWEILFWLSFLCLFFFLLSIPAFFFLHVHYAGCHDGLVSGLNTVGHYGCGGWRHYRMAFLSSDWVGL